jgi:hypothetical protein
MLCMDAYSENTFSEKALDHLGLIAGKKAIEGLFGKKLEASFFNDDILGCCWDAIAAYGRSTLFAELRMNIAREKGVFGRSAHGDNSNLPLYGEYP